jgi:hypothetical protein
MNTCSYNLFVICRRWQGAVKHLRTSQEWQNRIAGACFFMRKASPDPWQPFRLMRKPPCGLGKQSAGCGSLPGLKGTDPLNAETFPRYQASNPHNTESLPETRAAFSLIKTLFI